MVDVELVAGTGGVNPNENLGVSAGLEGSEIEVVLVVVVAPEGLKAKGSFVVLRAGAGTFAT